jgi:hypothetical protein
MPRFAGSTAKTLMNVTSFASLEIVVMGDGWSPFDGRARKIACFSAHALSLGGRDRRSALRRDQIRKADHFFAART